MLEFRLLFPLSYIGQSVHPAERGGWSKGLGKEWTVILDRYKFHFIRAHDNLVQDPSNNKFIINLHPDI